MTTPYSGLRPDPTSQQKTPQHEYAVKRRYCNTKLKPRDMQGFSTAVLS